MMSRYIFDAAKISIGPICALGFQYHLSGKHKFGKFFRQFKWNQELGRRKYISITIYFIGSVEVPFILFQGKVSNFSQLSPLVLFELCSKARNLVSNTTAPKLSGCTDRIVVWKKDSFLSSICFSISPWDTPFMLSCRSTIALRWPGLADRHDVCVVEVRLTSALESLALRHLKPLVTLGSISQTMSTATGSRSEFPAQSLNAACSKPLSACG